MFRSAASTTRRCRRRSSFISFTALRVGLGALGRTAGRGGASFARGMGKKRCPELWLDSNRHAEKLLQRALQVFLETFTFSRRRRAGRTNSASRRFDGGDDSRRGTRSQVSVATVSRAINGQGSVSESARARIVEAAAALRYVPHGAARSLITRRTNTIGVLLPDLHGEFFSELIRGIDQAAREQGYHILVSSSHGDAREASAALITMRGRVDGVLVMSPHVDQSILDATLISTLPVMLMNTPVPGTEHPSIMVDNHHGLHDGVAHVESGIARSAARGREAIRRDRRERAYAKHSPTCCDGEAPYCRRFTESPAIAPPGSSRAGRATGRGVRQKRQWRSALRGRCPASMCPRDIGLPG